MTTAPLAADRPHDIEGGGADAAGIVDRALVERCVARLRPVLIAAAGDTWIDQSGVLHLVVMDPARDCTHDPFDESVLAEFSFGRPRAEWDFEYAGAAREKARLSWLHRCDSHIVQQQPHRLRRHQSLLWGGVCLDGIVVAASGAVPQYDEAISSMLAALIRAEASLYAEVLRESGALRLE